MGAYENPQTVVDTQSGQIWANTIDRVTKATTNYIDLTRQKNDEYAKKVQAQLDWAADYAANKQEQIYANISRLGADSIYSKEADVVLNEITSFRIDMKNSSNKEDLKIAQEGFGKAQKKLQQLYQIIEMDEASKEFYKDELDPAIAGGQGGMSTSKPGTADWVAAQNINNGFAKGAKEVYWNNEAGGYRVKFTGENIEGEVDQDARLLFGYDPGVVPNINDMIKKIYIDQGFFNKNGDLTEKAMSDYMYAISSSDGKYEALKQATAVNRIAEATTPAFEATARSFFTVPGQAEDVWAIIGKNSNKEFNTSELMQEGSEMQTAFVNNFVKYASKQLPNSKQQSAFQRKKDFKSKSDIENNMLEDINVFQQRFAENAKGFGMQRNQDGILKGSVKFSTPQETSKSLAGLGYTIVGDPFVEDGIVTEVKVKKNGASDKEAFSIIAGQQPYAFYRLFLEAEGVGSKLAEQISKNLLYTGQINEAVIEDATGFDNDYPEADIETFKQ